MNDHPTDATPCLCPKCSRPATFIRTRHLEHGDAEVWMCSTEGCANYSLYFYPESGRTVFPHASNPEREAAIAADVFNPAESDLQYFERRRKELGISQKPTKETKDFPHASTNPQSERSSSVRRVRTGTGARSEAGRGKAQRAPAGVFSQKGTK